MCEHFCFPLEVDFCINVGCIDGDVAQPRADGVDVDTRAQEMCGCRMPNGVRADSSAKQGRMRGSSSADVVAEHRVDAMAGNRLAKPIEKDRFIE